MEEKQLPKLVSSANNNNVCNTNGQQQFNLRWNNHTNNILQVFTEQLATEALVDVTLSCEGQFIKAHKMILSACSPYFQNLFRLHHTVSHPVIIMNGMKYSDVKQVIDFMYRGEVKVLEIELDSLLAVAETLQVKGLSSVRNYEKNEQITTNETIKKQQQPQTNKKRKLSNDEESFTSQTSSLLDDELSSIIKIEPPVIQDIDQDENEDEEIKIMSKSIKTSRSGRTIRPKMYNHTETSQIRSVKYQNNNNNNNNNNSSCSSSGTTEQTAVAVANTKICKIPRPPNAFMIFANEWRRKLATEYPQESNKDISVRLGIMWKNLSSDAKEDYYSASRKADEEHKRKYPGYYYSPKEARIRKTKKESMMVTKSPRQKLEALHLVQLVMKDNDDDHHNTTSIMPSTDTNKNNEMYMGKESLNEVVIV